MWGFSGVFFGVYAIVQDLNIPLIVQPQLLSSLSYLSWAQVNFVAFAVVVLLVIDFLCSQVPILWEETIKDSGHTSVCSRDGNVCWLSSWHGLRSAGVFFHCAILSLLGLMVI